MRISTFSVLVLSFLAVANGYLLEWEGGTIDTYSGVTHSFRNLPSDGGLFLTAEVIQTDYSGNAEFVNGIFANGLRLLSSCNPAVDNVMQFFVCLINRDVSSIVIDGVLNVSTTATPFVNLNPFEGNLLHVRYTLSDSLFPTAAPSSPPSFAPTVKGSSPAPSSRPSHRPTSHRPTLAPTTQEPTRVPTRATDFDLTVEVGTNNVTKGISYSFIGIGETTVAYLEVDVLQTDFNDPDEFISDISVNGVTASNFCNPNGQSTELYSNCLRNYESYGSSAGTVTVTVKATPRVNCCPYKGFVLYARLKLTYYPKPTFLPTASPSHNPTIAPTNKPSVAPSFRPTSTVAPSTMRPTRQPSFRPSAKPTSAPSSSFPTLIPGFLTVFEGGTNNVRQGVSNRFTGLIGATVFVRVEVYTTDFSDKETESIDSISVNGKSLLTNCFPSGAVGFIPCIHNADVTLLVDIAGTLNVRVTATAQVNSYPHNGFLLYVKISVSDSLFPSPFPSASPSVQPSTEPSGMPTGAPSVLPTSFPTSRPVFRPSNKPSGQPTGSPSGQPSGCPTCRPSCMPTSNPSISPTTLAPTFATNAWFYWVPVKENVHYSSKVERVYDWSDVVNWNMRKIPGIEVNGQIIDDRVSIYLDRDQAIIISEAIAVHNLNLSGYGSLYFTGSNASLTVTNEWYCSMHGGRFKNLIPLEHSKFHLFGTSTIVPMDSKNSIDTLIIDGMHITNNGPLFWYGGSIIGASSTIENNPTGTMHFQSSKPLHLLTDTSRNNFRYYPNFILNENADLPINLPAGQAIRDIAVRNTVRLEERLMSDSLYKDLWTLQVSASDEAIFFYDVEVGHTLKAANFNHTLLYDKQFFGINSSHRCAELCLTFKWCASFEFINATTNSSACKLSRYYGFDVGGLTELGQSSLWPVSAHFELQTDLSELTNTCSSLNGSSSLLFINTGSLIISGASEIKLDLLVSMHGSGSMIIVDNATVVLNRGAVLEDTSSIRICNGVLRIEGGELIANSSHSVINSDCLSELSGDIVRRELEIIGSLAETHYISAALSNISLHLSERSIVRMTNLPGDVLSLNELIICGGASLMISEYSLPLLGTVLAIANRLFIEGEGSSLLGSNMTITADTVMISHGALLSTNGMGYRPGEGLGPGSNHSLSASGGSHGGLGGPGLVDSIGPSYGSSFRPRDFGSGGGSSVGGVSPTVGGRGGGSVLIKARVMDLDGSVSCDGMSPEINDLVVKHLSGAGGGAGGSILIEVSEVFIGSGFLSAVGGKGAFAGMAVSGGGGAGGRVAVHCSAMALSRCAFLETGSFSIFGARRLPSCDPAFEQAAPGTLYIATEDSVAILVSASKLENVSSIMTLGAISQSSANDEDITCATAGSSPPITRPAQFGDSNSQNQLINLYISQSGHAVLSSDTILLSDIVGGTPYPNTQKNSISVVNNSSLHLSPNFNVLNAEILVMEGTILLPDVVVIGKGSNLVLYSSSMGCVAAHQLSNRCELLQGQFVFSDLTVQRGAALTVYNQSVNISSARMKVEGGGVLNVLSYNMSATLHNMLLTLEDSAVISGDGMLLVDSSTSVIIFGFINITSVRIVLSGRLAFNGGGLLSSSYIVNIKGSFDIMGDVIFELCSDKCNLVIEDKGLFAIHEDVTLFLGARLSILGFLSIANGASVNMTNGADVSSGGVVTVDSSSLLSFATGIYAFHPLSRLSGTGLIVASLGSLCYIPRQLSINTEVHTDGALLVYGAEPTVKVWNITNITVFAGGWLNFSTPNVAVNIELANIIGGSLYIEGSVTISTELRLRDSIIMGSGSLTVRPKSLVVLAKHSTSIIRELSLKNYGSLVSEYKSIFLFGSAAALLNNGNISMHAESYWGLLSKLHSAFIKYPSSTYATSLPIWSSESVLLDECAEICWGYDVTYSRKVSTARISAIKTQRPLFKCESFEYNSALQSCRLFSHNTSGFTGSRTCDISRESFAWDIYERKLDFDQLPTLVNKIGGTVTSDVTSSYADLTSELSYVNFRFPAALPAIGISFNAENGSSVNVAEGCYLGLRFGFVSDETAQFGIEQDGVLEISAGSADTASVYQKYKDDSSMFRNDSRSSSAAVLKGSFQGHGTIIFSYSGVRDDADANSSYTIGFDSFIILDDKMSISINNVALQVDPSIRQLIGTSLSVHRGILRSSSPINYVFRDFINITKGGIIESEKSVIETDYNTDCTVNTLRLYLDQASRLQCSRLFIDAKTVIVSGNSTITTSGRGYGLLNHIVNASKLNDSFEAISSHSGNYKLIGSTGGSHGGVGGNGYLTTGVIGTTVLSGYGSYEAPVSWGSPGGCSINDPFMKSLINIDADGSGGGSLHIRSDIIVISDRWSSILSNGSPAAENTVCGGGSGGSVIINTTLLLNSGAISANGGDGGMKHGIIVGAGGGGGGGRIALYINDAVNSFLGTSSARGGSGFEAGSAGTILKFLGNSVSANQVGLSVLTVANYMQTTSRTTPLSYNVPLPLSESGFLDVLQVMEGSAVVIDVSDNYASETKQFNVRTICGDGSGTVRVINATHLASYPTYLAPTQLLSFFGYNNNPLVHSDWSFAVINVSIVIKDASINASKVILYNGQLSISSQGSSAHSGISAFTKGVYYLDAMSILHHSTVYLSYDDEIMTPGGCPPSDSIILVNVSGAIRIDSTSSLQSNAQGCLGSEDIGILRTGGAFGGAGGGGGGHGGEGGAGLSANGGSSSQDRIYSSIESQWQWTYSLLFGSGGGGTYPMIQGGRGGGVINVIAEVLDLNGTISADGSSGYGAGTGGGSGGSVFIQIRHAAGFSGVVTATGGDGLYNSARMGGPGGGGIISIVMDNYPSSSKAFASEASLGWPYVDTVTAYGGQYRESLDNLQITDFSSKADGNDLFDFLNKASADGNAGCAASSNRLGPGAGIVHLGWGNQSVLTVRGRESSTLSVVRSTNVADAEVFETLRYDLCSGLTYLYSTPVKNYTSTQIFIGNAAHILIGSGAGFFLMKIVNDGSGLVTVPENSSLYLPSDITIDGGHWFIFGKVYGADIMLLSSTTALSLYPSGRWDPCYSFMNYTIAKYMELVTGLSCPFMNFQTSSGIWNGRLNTFRFFSVTLEGSAGIFVKGGNRYRNYPRAILELIGTSATNTEFTSLALLNSQNFISATAEGFNGEAIVGTSKALLPKFDLLSSASTLMGRNDSNHRVLCGRGGAHAGSGGYCYYGTLSREEILRNTVSSGVASAPLEWGGGGGASYEQRGGNGGGSIHILVKGRNSGVMLNGIIRADGKECQGGYCGGGAGGSVWIDIAGLGPGSNLRGTGVLSAIGASAVNERALGGAGGRIAVYDPAAGMLFDGTVLVHAGDQNVTIYSNVLPAGGTFYLFNSSSPEGETILVVQSTGVAAEAGTTIKGGNSAALCADLVAGRLYPDLVRKTCEENAVNIDQILLSSGNLVINANTSMTCKVIISASVFSSNTAISNALSLNHGNIGGSVILLESSEIKLSSCLNISFFAVELLDGRLEMSYGNNVTIGSGGSLLLSQSLSQVDLTGVPASVRAALKMEFQGTSLSSKMGLFYFTNLEIIDGGVVKVISDSSACNDSASSLHLIIFANLLIGESAVLSAREVCASDAFVHCLQCGAHGAVNGRHGAGGGGHAGFGTLGAFSTSPGLPKGHLLQPTGGGGFGGSVLNSDGGAGGGGLRVSVLHDATVKGLVDVSGGHATSSVAGGGAGGSLWMKVLGTLQGSRSGILKANGGHGGLSYYSDTCQYGGAGSAGRIHIEAGDYSSDDGSTVCRLLFPSRGNSAAWPSRFILRHEAIGGLSVLNPSCLSEINQTSSAIFGDEILKYLYCEDCTKNSLLTVSGAAGSVIYSVLGGAQTLFIRSWSEEQLQSNHSEKVAQIHNISRSGAKLFTSITSLLVNSTNSSPVKFERVYLEHGNCKAIVHNSLFSTLRGTLNKVESLFGSVRMREIIGTNSSTLMIASDIYVEPAVCNSYSGCVSCPTVADHAEFILQSINVDLKGIFRAGLISNTNLLLDDSSLLIAPTARYLAVEDGAGELTFTFGNVSLISRSYVYGEKIDLLVTGNIILNHSSAIHADGMSSADNRVMANVGASGGSHGGKGLPGISSYYYYSQITQANFSTVVSDISDIYGNALRPNSIGTGGGSTAIRVGWNTIDFESGREGSAAGGIVRIQCLGSIILAGMSRLSADGNSLSSSTRGAGSGGGGGSGGSVSVSAANLIEISNTASLSYDAIRAVGGSTCSSMSYGGNGGGGRVAITLLPTSKRNHYIKSINSWASGNPFIGVNGRGVLGGGHDYLFPATVTASAGLTMDLNKSDLVPVYPNHDCGNYDPSVIPDYLSRTSQSLWTVEKLTDMALQPIFKGTVYTDILPSSIPVFNPNVTVKVHYVSWNKGSLGGSSLSVTGGVFFGDAIDIYLTERPTWVRETLTFCDAEERSTYNGYWRLGYGGVFSSASLRPFAPALDVLNAIYALKSLPSGGINVYFSDLREEKCHGFAYDIVFFSTYGEHAVQLLRVDISDLFISSGASIYNKVQYSAATVLNYNDSAVSLFNKSEIQNLVNFSHDIMSDSKSSFAFWAEPDVLRIIPDAHIVQVENNTLIAKNTASKDFSQFVGKLYVRQFRPFPTQYGWFMSNSTAMTLMMRSSQ